ncbi:hypothetical protein [Roseateles violae]|uniref:Uncharacterized protein n=1 Tax=Roseateles violae TaxID=3058042 RepID=A0ABT8DTW2_9BURK|nr:hypothetical protein [Pelomonas sp. PFR6]MDN3921516.1 hypothetical protein [Pelomonas sp. PFR6]
MTTDTQDLAPEGGAIPADLAAIAAAADSQIDAGAGLPGMAEAAAQQTAAAADQAERELGEISAALCLAVKFGGYVEPALPRYYTPEACGEIAGAYLECAEKYGWTFHRNIATGPELKLGAAIAVPAFMVWQERSARLQAQAQEARARQLAARGGGPAGVQAQQTQQAQRPAEVTA